MHSFTFDGRNSREYCELFVSGGGTFNAPERDIESIPIPGRNGELTIDHGRYKNIQVSYPAWIAKDFKMNARKARNWLCGCRGYKRLEDDYHPDEFRMARFVGGLSFETLPEHLAGRTTLEFDCMPQRWLTSGEAEISVSGTDTVIFNPTEFDSQPKIFLQPNAGDKIKSFSLIINDETLVIATNCNSEIIIDVEIQNAYSFDKSGKIAITGTYPELKPEENAIKCLDENKMPVDIRIVPRWWII